MHVVHKSAWRICVEYVWKVDYFGDVYRREVLSLNIMEIF
jgi:hypothetical protein